MNKRQVFFNFVIMLLVGFCLFLLFEGRILDKELHKDLENIQTYLGSIMKREIKESPVKSFFDYRNDPYIGSEDAPAQFIIFTDYQCPYCIQLQQTLIPRILELYGGKVRFLFKNYPLEELHDQAFFAALLSEWAHETGHFESFYSTISEDPASFLEGGYLDWARNRGLEMDDFEKASVQRRLKGAVQQDIADAASVGVSVTPSIINGGILYPGAPSFNKMTDLISTQLLKKNYAMTIDELERSLGDIIAVDVRSEEEYLTSHIAHAENIPWNSEDFFINVASYDDSKPMVFYCNRGITSLSAVSTLQGLGFENTYSLSDGFFSWTARENPTVYE